MVFKYLHSHYIEYKTINFINPELREQSTLNLNGHQLKSYSNKCFVRMTL